MSIANVFVECAILHCHSHNGGQAQVDPPRLPVLVHKVDLDVLNGRAPAIEAKDLIGKIDDLFCRQVVHLSAPSTWSRRDVFRAQLFFESALQSGNLLGSVFGNARFGFDEGVDSVGVVAVLVAWAGGKSAWSRNSAVGANVVQCRGTYAGIVGYLAASGEGVGIVCVVC